MLLTCQACSCACEANQFHENKRCAFTAHASKAVAADTDKRNKSLRLQHALPWLLSRMTTSISACFRSSSTLVLSSCRVPTAAPTRYLPLLSRLGGTICLYATLTCMHNKQDFDTLTAVCKQHTYKSDVLSDMQSCWPSVISHWFSGPKPQKCKKC